MVIPAILNAAEDSESLQPAGTARAGQASDSLQQGTALLEPAGHTDVLTALEGSLCL